MINKINIFSGQKETLAQGMTRITSFGNSMNFCANFIEENIVPKYFPPHNHPNEQATLWLAGKARLTIGKEAIVVEAGDVFFIPADVPHSAELLEGPIIELDWFFPEREDMRKGEDSAKLFWKSNKQE